MPMTSPKFKDQLHFKKQVFTPNMVEVKGANRQKVSIPKVNMAKVHSSTQ